MTRCLPVLLIFIAVAFAYQRCAFEPDNQYINRIPPELLAVNIEVNDPKLTDPFYNFALKNGDPVNAEWSGLRATLGVGLLLEKRE
jgi:hypothetical protein